MLAVNSPSAGHNQKQESKISKRKTRLQTQRAAPGAEASRGHWQHAAAHTSRIPNPSCCRLISLPSALVPMYHAEKKNPIKRLLCCNILETSLGDQAQKTVCLTL